MVLMRAASATSAVKLGVNLMGDVSRCTIVRWEAKVAAGLLAAKRFWRRDNDKLMKDGSKRSLRPYRIQSIQSDGTNANIFHKQSLQVPYSLALRIISEIHLTIHEIHEILIQFIVTCRCFL